MNETHTISENDMAGLAERVVELLSLVDSDRAKVVLLEGDLGAGKTTLTKELAKLLGIEKETVNSPTFILKKEYKAGHPKFKKMIHIDGYRFNHPSESKVLRLNEDLRDKETVIAIEWPSKMTYVRPDIKVSFVISGEDDRVVTISYEKDI